jgi:DNA-directed RNA polymerase specialized sigma24 family protein
LAATNRAGLLSRTTEALARWLTRDDHAAEDVVQEAYLRALKFFGSFRCGDGKAWILAIVRNACFDWLKLRRTEELHWA